ncbi:MAG: DinB family protein [Gemmatimonadales bacterium]
MPRRFAPLRPLTLALSLLAVPPLASAQAFEPGMRTAFLADFDRTAGKFLALAEAFDPAQYDWRPGPGVRSVREVFAVLIGENGSLMPESFGTAPLPGFPAGQTGFAAIGTVLDTASKATIVQLLKTSFEVNRTAWAAAPEATLGTPHPFFGSEAPASRIALTMLARRSVSRVEPALRRRRGAGRRPAGRRRRDGR